MKLLLTLILMLPLSSFASDKGNGGDGIEIGKNLYVLDLVEAGVESSPYIDMTLPVDSKLENELSLSLDPKIYPIRAISQKIIQLRKYDPIFAYAIEETIKLFSWRMVNSALIDIKDEDTILSYEKLKQLAIRKNTFILIDKAAWGLLDVGNKVALIFHEVLYAMVEPVRSYPRYPGSSLYKYAVQKSDNARELNGYLFSDTLDRDGLEGLAKVAGVGFNKFFQSGFTAFLGSIIFSEPSILVSGASREMTSNNWRFSLNLDPVEMASFDCKKPSPISIEDVSLSWSMYLATYEDDSTTGKGPLTKYYVKIAYQQGTYNLSTRAVIEFKTEAECREKYVTELKEKVKILSKFFKKSQE